MKELLFNFSIRFLVSSGDNLLDGVLLDAGGGFQKEGFVRGHLVEDDAGNR